jgi:hypothetical protein
MGNDGANGVFPKPFESDSRYDHLDAAVRAADLMRLDVGCEWEHHQLFPIEECSGEVA